MGLFLNRGREGFDRVLTSGVYVDKTDMLGFCNERINTEQSCICVCRPRRFGKSITANMIGAYYQKDIDTADMFEGRKLSQIENWDQYLNQFQVIKIDLAEIVSEKGTPAQALDYIEETLLAELDQRFEGILQLPQDGLATSLARIYQATHEQFVIIIDEWDCIFRDEKSNIAVQMRYMNLLHSLFKGDLAKGFLALAYLTGILPIKKYNSESALNNFDEYTVLNPGKLASYIGFTEDEVQTLCEQYDMDYEQTMSWYDGYSFPTAKHICGPNSIVKAMLRHEFANYWSQTVAFNSLQTYITMNFDGLKDAIISAIGGQKIPVAVMSFANDMVSFRRKDDVLTVLIHLGYLAYDSQNETAYIPNKEVRQIFERTIKHTGWDELIDTINHSEELLLATIDGDAEEVARQIDYSHMVNTSILQYNNENALASCIMLAYYTARKEYTIVRELPSGRGFADLVFIPKRGVDKPAMIVELKWKKDAQTAIDQIKDRRYPEVLADYKDHILLVGVSYDKNDEQKKHTCVIEEIPFEQKL